MNIDFILRILIIIGIIGGGIIWLYYFCKTRKCKRNYGIAPLLFVANALVYTIVSALGLLSKQIYLVWGDLVSLHGIVILITIGILLIQLEEGGKK
jgi:hypothetical protein